MNVLSTKKNRKGKKVVTVELEEGEQLMAFDEASHYKLGRGVDDIVHGGVVTESQEVYWCSIQQEWVDR